MQHHFCQYKEESIVIKPENNLLYYFLQCQNYGGKKQSLLAQIEKEPS